MSILLNDLDYRFKPVVFEFIARCAEAGIPLQIIFTGRTQEEQNALYAQGRTTPGKVVTWTLDSKHVMKDPDSKSLAIDVCPFDQFQLHGPDKLAWNDSDPVWDKMGIIGERVGMKWGVVDGNGNRKDKGHFEYKKPEPITRSDGFVA